MVFLGTPNLSTASLFVMPFSMCDRMSHFSFKFFVFSLRLTEIFVLATLRTKSRFFFHLRSKFLFWFKFKFIREFENENRICKCSRWREKMVQRTKKFVRYREKFEIEKLGKFQETKNFVWDREIFEIEGSLDRESPLYLLPKK